MGNIIRAEVSGEESILDRETSTLRIETFLSAIPNLKKAYSSLNGMLSRRDALNAFGKARHVSNPTERIAILKHYYSIRMEMIEKVAKETDPELASTY